MRDAGPRMHSVACVHAVHAATTFCTYVANGMAPSNPTPTQNMPGRRLHVSLLVIECPGLWICWKERS